MTFAEKAIEKGMTKAYRQGAINECQLIINSIDRVVKQLCQDSQAPGDKFDLQAMAVGAIGDSVQERLDKLQVETGLSPTI